MARRNIGSYQLTKQLGAGRTAEVWAARQKKTGELVAVKLLHEYLTESRDKQFFLHEAEIVQRLDHPGIVRIIDANFHENTRPYIVMTYAPGNTLRKRYAPGTPLPLETIRSYTHQLADALEAAHQQNIVHCDVKPENVLIGKDDRLMLSDFGIAQIIETTYSMKTREAFGTATYMAPEQFRGKYSPATDQYALAIMVYEWLCGHPPFSGKNSNQLMDRHINMPVPSLKEACEGRTEDKAIWEKVEPVVLRALAKDSHARFASIQNFARALEEALPIPEPIVTEPLAPEPKLAITRPLTDDSTLPPVPIAKRKRKFKLSPAFRVAIFGLLAVMLLSSGGLGVYHLANARWPWQPISLPSLQGVIWADSQFVAVGGDGEYGTILTSPDGHNWTIQKSNTLTHASGSTSLNAIAWGNSQFVAVGNENAIFTSPNGYTWTEQTNPSNPFIGSVLHDIAWSGSQFVAVGDNETILTSPDGKTWTTQKANSSSPVSFRAVIWTDSQFVAVGDNGTILTSHDGITWISQHSSTTETLYAVARSNSQFVAVGYGGTILTSPDARTWAVQQTDATPSPFSDDNFTVIVWSGSQFVAIGYGDILTSPNGRTWRTQHNDSLSAIQGLSWSGSQFTAVGSDLDSNNGTISTSPNGQTWAEQYAYISN